MTGPFNTSLEVGVRVLFLLERAYPRGLDLSTLVLWDYGMLHTADIGGPPSLHPAFPIRVGEFGIKRQNVKRAIQLLLQSDLIEARADRGGIDFMAAEGAHPFVSLLASDYSRDLRQRADWVVSYFGEMTPSAVRSELRNVFDVWSEEFSTSADSRQAGD